MPEAVLLRKACAGDRAALGELLMAHERACYGFALHLTGNAADAEDVCQEAFTRATRDIGTAGGIDNFRSWLLKIVVCAQRNRRDSDVARRRRERSYAMQQPSVDHSAFNRMDQTELYKSIEHALSALDERYALPIVLHHQQGLSHARTAAVLSMPEGTVKANIHRGLEELRATLGRAGFACAAPVLTATLSKTAISEAPASLTTFVKSLAASGKGAGAEAGATAIGWKVAAALAMIAMLGTGAFMLRDNQANLPVAPVQETAGEAVPEKPKPPAPQPQPLKEEQTITRPSIVTVKPGLPAEKAGFKEGDIIVSVNGRLLEFSNCADEERVKASAIFGEAKKKKAPLVFVVRRNSVDDVTLTIPMESASGIWGIDWRITIDYLESYLKSNARTPARDTQIKDGLRLCAIHQADKGLVLLKQVLDSGHSSPAISEYVSRMCVSNFDINDAEKYIRTALNADTQNDDRQYWLNRVLKLQGLKPIDNLDHREAALASVGLKDPLDRWFKKGAAFTKKRDEWVKKGIIQDLNIAEKELSPFFLDKNECTAPKGQTMMNVLPFRLNDFVISFDLKLLPNPDKIPGRYDDGEYVGILLFEADNWIKKPDITTQCYFYSWSLSMQMDKPSDSVKRHGQYTVGVPVAYPGPQIYKKLEGVKCPSCGQECRDAIFSRVLIDTGDCSCISENRVQHLKIIRQGSVVEYFMDNKLALRMNVEDAPLAFCLMSYSQPCTISRFSIYTAPPKKDSPFAKPVGNKLPPGNAYVVSFFGDNGYAAWLGLRKGDVIAEYAGKTPKNLAELKALTEMQNPSELVKMSVVRDGKEYVLEVAPRNFAFEELTALPPLQKYQAKPGEEYQGIPRRLLKPSNIHAPPASSAHPADPPPPGDF
jgi:RNA polymerase sigma-70 factor (ECF subfamily)